MKIKKTVAEDKKDVTQKQDVPPFSEKEDMMVLLKALSRHGYANLPFDILPGMSSDERHSVFQSVFNRTRDIVKNKPSIIDWLSSGLFEDNEYNIPLTLLLIALYEQHPSSSQENKECDFREIYHFLYKITTNQPIPYLSDNSAMILHKLLLEIIEEVWPDTQQDLLKYLTKIHIYSRSIVRRTYPGKKTVVKEEVQHSLFQV